MNRFFIFLFIIFITSCSSKEEASKNVLSVTMEPYRYVVEAVAGDDWEVRSIVPKGGNPETFDPAPGDIMLLSESRACFLVGGLGFEREWKDKMAVLYPKMTLVDTSRGIERDAGDPHLWTSPDNMIKIADNVCKALCKIDSTRSTGYHERLVKLKDSIYATHAILKRKLEKVKGKSFLIFHPSLTYFSSLYGLRQISIECEGKEPSVAHLQTVIDAARAQGVNCVLVQAEFDRRSAIAIADEIGARVEEINPLSYYWHEQMLHIADVLSK